MDRLPLFPLGTALLPGATLGLQVFEPRYVELLRDLVGPDGSGEGATWPEPVFGVVGIRKGFEVGDRIRDTHDVGCTARIERLGVLGPGVYGLLAEGERRFHLRAVDEAAGSTYLTGLVDWIDEPVGDETRAGTLARQVVAEIDAAGGPETDDAVPDDPTALSYWVARAADLGPGDAQLLLASPDTSRRLGLALTMLRRERRLGAQLGVELARPVTPPPSSLN